MEKPKFEKNEQVFAITINRDGEAVVYEARVNAVGLFGFGDDDVFYDLEEIEFVYCLNGLPEEYFKEHQLSKDKDELLANIKTLTIK